jgi:hypothetical protein
VEQLVSGKESSSSGQVHHDRRLIRNFIFARCRPSPAASRQGVFTITLSQFQDTRLNSQLFRPLFHSATDLLAGINFQSPSVGRTSPPPLSWFLGVLAQDVKDSASKGAASSALAFCENATPLRRFASGGETQSQPAR